MKINGDTEIYFSAFGIDCTLQSNTRDRADRSKSSRAGILYCFGVLYGIYT